jgi:glycosyltransferase involved in cell wall biosynthesis
VTRVLILNERDPRHPKAGGAEVHVAEIFGRLARRGHRVAMASSLFAGAAREERVEDIAVLRVGGLPFYYPRAAWACARASRRGEYDLVVECLNKLPFLAPVYSRVPVLALCHHLFGETAFQQVPWPIAATVWSVERLIPRLYRRERFVAISESTRDDLARRGIAPDRIEVHHPGIERPGLPIPDLAARGRRVVYVGRLERYKNVDVLIRAMARLAGRFPDTWLDVIGEGRDRARLEEVAREVGMAERTRFTGFISEQERNQLLAGARVCVCPSSKEGWGLTVIEANALGTPNVASDAPGLRDSVRHGETGFLVRDGDVGAFAERIGALLADDALAARMSAAALEWSRRFEWERAADQMEAALETALARSPR